jgi:transcriptional regulator with XRE-family HTH domain
MITGMQVRAAKALLNWSGSELSERAGVGLSTVRRIEACDGLLITASIKVLQAIQTALEAGGVQFVGAPEDRPGVRLNK